MTKGTPFQLIGSNGFKAEVIEASKPVLVLYMLQSAESQEQIKIIENIAEKHGEAVKICLLKEDFHGVFSKKYGVKGSPTFMIFIEGEEKGRMLGQADQKTLTDFLLETLPSLQGGGSR